MSQNCWNLMILFTTILIIGGKSTKAQIMPDETLISLARQKFVTLASEEEGKAFDNFFQRTQDGQISEFTPKAEMITDTLEFKILTDPVYAGLWKKDRVVRAEWLEWLCTDPKASAKVTSRGIQIAGARIEGKLNLTWAKVQFPISAFKCSFTDDMIFDRATVGSLQLQSTFIRNLNGDGVTVERDVSLVDGCRAEGKVWLRHATINGALTLDSSYFINPGKTALDLEATKIGSVYMRKGFQAEGQVNMYAAVINGTVDCDNGHFSSVGSVALDLEAISSGQVLLWNGFASEGEVSLMYATISNVVDCDNGHFINPESAALDFQGSKTGSIFMRKPFEADGAVVLYNAVVGGSLECQGGQFTSPGTIALNLEGVKTASVFMGDGFRADGEVRLLNADVEGDVLCDGGKFINPHGMAINFESAKTGSVQLRNHFRAEGQVNLLDALIVGNLELTGGQFIDADEMAINATSAHVQDNLLLDGGFEVDGQAIFRNAQIDESFRLKDGAWDSSAVLDLRSAKAKTLLNDRTGWPRHDQLLLHGFTYDQLDAEAELTARSQVAWIQCQSSQQFFSQPYEQAASVLKNMGLPEESIGVMIAKNQDYGRRVMAADKLVWYKLFGPFIGYGYLPWNAFYCSLLVVATGYLIFKAAFLAKVLIPTSESAYKTSDGRMLQLKTTYPKFNAFIYSFESFVPLVNLGIKEHWTPNANSIGEFPILKTNVRVFGSIVRCYLWSHILMGWVLTTLWVGGFTGLIKS